MPHENCDNCHTDYDFTTENATLNVFIEDYQANFIEAKCPHCGTVERIYAGADAIMHIVASACVGFALHARADDETLERAANAWNTKADQEEESWPALPEAPKHLLRELYDDLRNWKGVME